MDIQKINIKEKFTRFNELWSPKIIAQLNDYHFKIAKIEGKFVWHSHPETDEVFIVIDGEFKMQLREGSFVVAAGEMCVIPKGVEHQPVAEKECAILMIEPAGTLNTGDAGGEHTVEKPDWI